MNDAISRQAAITAIQKAYADTEGGMDKLAVWKNVGLTNALHIMQDLPSAQPEQKKGRWLPDNRPGGGFWVCSCCKFPSEAFAANVLYKFCPNCGADMRGEQK